MIGRPNKRKRSTNTRPRGRGEMRQEPAFQGLADKETSCANRAVAALKRPKGGRERGRRDQNILAAVHSPRGWGDRHTLAGFACLVPRDTISAPGLWDRSVALRPASASILVKRPGGFPGLDLLSQLIYIQEPR